MSEKFVTKVDSVASGTDKTLLNVFHAAAAPTCRGRIAAVIVGGAGTPDDRSANFYLGRTTVVGTEGGGLVPNNIDPGGPAGEMDSGIGVFTVEPTYTAGKQLLAFNMNHRGTFKHNCDYGWELYMAAVQNAGAGLKTTSSTATQAHGATIFFEE